MPLPVPTTSQSMDHAVAQPQKFTSPISLPERFQKFHLFGHPGSSAGPKRSDRLVRPSSVYSNTSSIEQLQDEEDQGRSGSSAQHTISYVGRRRITGPNGPLNRPQSYGGRPLSIGTFTSTLSSRSYSDDQVDRVNGLHSEPIVRGGLPFNGTATAQVVPSNHSNLSKSWVYTPGTGSESIQNPQEQLAEQLEEQQRQQEQEQPCPLQRIPQQLSHRPSTLSPSSTLVSDNLQEQIEQGSHESLAKSPAPGASVTSSRQDTYQSL